MAQNQIIQQAQSYWRALSLPVKIAVCAVAVLVCAVVFTRATDAISKRRYEKEAQRLQTETTQAKGEAAEWMDLATQAEKKVQVLELELSKVNQQLLDANAELQDAHITAAQTRTVYVTKTNTKTIPAYITGNPSVDSRELCARLRAAGFECK